MFLYRPESNAHIPRNDGNFIANIALIRSEYLNFRRTISNKSVQRNDKDSNVRPGSTEWKENLSEISAQG